MDICNTVLLLTESQNMKSILLCAFLALSSNAAIADESFFSASIGFSGYGVFALEYQKSNHGIGVGFPTRIFYRYYKDPFENSLFYGLYAGRFKQNNIEDKVIDGVAYTDKTNSDAGVGIGYIWRWSSGWNVAASLSIHYWDQEYTNAEQQKSNDKTESVFPGISVGYRY